MSKINSAVTYSTIQTEQSISYVCRLLCSCLFCEKTYVPNFALSHPPPQRRKLTIKKIISFTNQAAIITGEYILLNIVRPNCEPYTTPTPNKIFKRQKRGRRIFPGTGLNVLIYCLKIHTETQTKLKVSENLSIQVSSIETTCFEGIIIITGIEIYFSPEEGGILKLGGLDMYQSPIFFLCSAWWCSQVGAGQQLHWVASCSRATS